MKLQSNFKDVVVQVVCLLYVLLFVYAGVSKLMDFENFRVQLGQSPLLSAFAWWVSWLVPVIELGLAILLIFQKFRSIVLLAALTLMSMFTSYIFIILHYSSFVPCSCGGILEKMSWNTHLLFNILFVFFAVLAIILNEQPNKRNNLERLVVLQPIKSILISVTFSVGLIIILFVSSEKIMHYKNPFIRQYNRRTVEFIASKDLKFNSYYFSGYSNKEIYLGNYTTPLKVLSIDTSFRLIKTIKIDFKNQETPFRLIKILIRKEHFYVMDGRIPCIYTGSTSNWKVQSNLKGVPYFTTAEPMDNSSFVFRNNTGINAANILGIYSSTAPFKIQYKPALLQKQIDGIFDTDGMLQFNYELGRIVFVYYYRNEFIIADKNGKLVRRSNTIDTISKAKIKVAYLKDGMQRKMSAPPLTVNAVSATHQNLLFIESKIQGMYENNPLWKHAAIIDVYNLKKKSYVLSFPVFGTEENKLTSLFVTDTNLYGIIGSRLVMYRLKGILKKEMKE